MSFPHYTDLVTIDDVVGASLDSLPEAILNAIATDEGSRTAKQTSLVDGIGRIITMWTSRIEEYLDRLLIVRPAREFAFPSMNWKYRQEFTLPTESRVFGARSFNWPVLQIESVDRDETDTTVTIEGFDQEFLVYSSADRSIAPVFVSHFWGYRRHDQDPPSGSGSGSGGGSGSGSASDWDEALATGTNELAGLDPSVFVPELPFDIALAAVRLIVAEIRTQSRGIVGIRESEHRADRLTSRTTRLDPEFIRDELSGLYKYKRGL